MSSLAMLVERKGIREGRLRIALKESHWTNTAPCFLSMDIGLIRSVSQQREA